MCVKIFTSFCQVLKRCTQKKIGSFILPQGVHVYRKRDSQTHKLAYITESPTHTSTTIPPHHTCPFNGPFSRSTQVSQYQKGKTNLDFTEARDSEWQWHQLGHMQVCTSLQTYNHASTLPLSFLQAGCPSCRPTNEPTASKH